MENPILMKIGKLARHESWTTFMNCGTHEDPSRAS